MKTATEAGIKKANGEGIETEGFEDLDKRFLRGPGSDFQAFFKERFSEGMFEIALYKQTDNGMELWHKYKNIVPSEDDIGKQFGSGLYVAYGRKPPEENSRAKTIRIGSIYDKRKEENINFPVPVPATTQIIQQKAPDVLGMFKEFVGIIKPMFDTNHKNNQQPEKQDKFLEGYQDMMLQNMKKFGKQYTDMVTEINDQRPEPEFMEPQKAPKTIVQELIEVFKQFGPAFLKKTGPVGDAYKTIIENDPRYNQAINDQNILGAVYDEAVKIGKKSLIQEIFKKLNIGVQEASPK